MAEQRRKPAGPSPQKSRDLADWVGEEKAEKITHLFDKVYPIFVILGNVINAVSPYIMMAWIKANQIWKALEPYQPWELSSVGIGTFMAFFGSRYLLLLSAIEAARQTGFETFTTHIAIIYDSFEKVYIHNLKDNAKDEDNNGVLDVDELSKKDLFTRKFKLFLKVTEPESLMAAFSGLWIAILAVVATLRLQFAQTICLGVSIGEAIEGPIQKFALPTIQAGVHKEYHKWIPVGIKQGTRFIGCSIAFLVTRIIGGFYAAIRGAQMFATGLIRYLIKFGYLAPKHNEKGVVYSGIVAGVFGLGFYFQIATFFHLPFPLSFFLFPATLAENFLMALVSSDVQTGAGPQS